LDRDGVLTDFDLDAATRFFAPRLPLTIWQISARWEAYGQAVGFPRSLAEETAFFRGFWDTVCDECGATAGVRRELQALDYTRYLVAYPDVRPALEQARRAGLRVGVLSNFSLASLDASLAATGLSDLIDAACAATVIGAAKPQAEAYRIAAQALGVAPEECLFFDDEPECVAGGQTVGMHAFRVDRRLSSHALDNQVVADLSALPLVLARVGH
jgi:putative hydrolase of the HAD superfamily